MSFKPEELKEILSIYKAESEEHLQKLNECLVRLEKETGNTEILEEIFREAHSLKGSARMIGFEAVERIAHGLEDLFGAARKGELELGGGTFDVFFECLDTIGKTTEKWLANPEGKTDDVSPLLERIAVFRAGAPPGDALPATGKVRPGGAEREELSRRSGEAGKGGPDERGQVRSAGDGAVEEEDSKSKKEAAGDQVRLEVEETIRVATRKLDDLMNQIGEILVTKIKFDQRLTEVRAFESKLEEIRREWAEGQRQMELVSISRSREMSPADVEFQEETGAKLSFLHDELSRFVTSFNEDSLRMTLISGELQESINRVRMLPLSSLFNLFPRLLRDIVRGEGKDVDLKVEGGEIQLDRKILERLKDPLTHILRNSLDHGIEHPEERTAAGKDGTGRIRLSAVQKASSVVIDIEDDGAGIDLEKVRSIALRRGFVTEGQLEEMGEQQIMAFIFKPGFSTKGIITDLSGRGVGLDVVFNSIEAMKGTISLFSEPGKGTRFSIKLPVSLATSQALVVRVGEQVFALPLTAVEVISEVGLKEVMTVESREAILVNETPTSLVRLSDILGLPSDPIEPESGDRAPVVVVGSTDERVALLVDEVVGEKEIVVKGLGSQLRRVRNISGATIMGDGSVVLILNVFDLIKSSQKVRGMWAAAKKADTVGQKTPHILVADDSVTTRVLEKNILESSGYRVTLAVDGIDALEKARAQPFDLVVSDVEMPRLNGFELTSKLRDEERFSELPVILVTSLDSEEDKKRGIEAGADAYITKGAFEQGNLLSTIRQLL